MSDQVKVNMQKLASLIKKNKINGFNQHLNEIFSSSENPVALFLDLIENTHRKMKPNSVAFYIVKYFSTWKEHSEKVSIGENVQWKILDIARNYHHKTTASLFHCFGIIGSGRALDTVKNFILKICNDEDYKEALMLVTELNLQNEFTLDHIVIPAFLQGNSQGLIDEYLQNASNTDQVEFLQLLDYLYVKNTRIQFCINNGILEEKLISIQSVCKLMKRLLKLFCKTDEASVSGRSEQALCEHF